MIYVCGLGSFTDRTQTPLCGIHRLPVGLSEPIPSPKAVNPSFGCIGRSPSLLALPLTGLAVALIAFSFAQVEVI